VTAIKM